jgi:hypothetical protein
MIKELMMRLSPPKCIDWGCETKGLDSPLLGRGIFGSGWQRQNLALVSLAKLDSDELDDMALSSR